MISLGGGSHDSTLRRLVHCSGWGAFSLMRAPLPRLVIETGALFVLVPLANLSCLVHIKDDGRLIVGKHVDLSADAIRIIRRV